jgi:AAA family ATP:ADP antiporter
VGIAFFLWVGIFNVFITAQFLDFANDVYTEEQGKRLFPMIEVGASLGAWVGVLIAEWAFGRFEPQSAPYSLMLLAGSGLGLSIIISYGVNLRESRNLATEKATRAEKPLGKEGGIQAGIHPALFIADRNPDHVDECGQYDGRLHPGQGRDFGVCGGGGRRCPNAGNDRTVLRKLFWLAKPDRFPHSVVLVSRIFKYIGIRGALFVLPCLALGSYALFIAAPILGIIRIFKLAENSTD